ncbi:MAG: PQQ-dependent sugar dehydrogenase [Pseudomonadota bacterium]
MLRSASWSLATTLVLSMISANALGAPSLSQFATGFSSPVFLTHAPGIAERLYVIEQGTAGTARIKSINMTTSTVTTVLTLNGVSTGGERGLLGLAFHPNVASNNYLYVYLSVPAAGLGNHDSLIRRYELSGPDMINAGSARDVLRFSQDFSNHNGGWIGFGPDGYLYIASGDGGAGGDPNNRAQNLNSLLGKMLRIDVDGDDFPLEPNRNYAIPASNPFVGAAGLDEIWHLGLRNPWRASFDRLTGDLYIGDVGQGSKEEISFQQGSSAGGLNYGWRVEEGFTCFDNSQTGGNPPCADPILIAPVYDYDHGSGPFEGFSVTGGYVYRGPADAILDGDYFFADFGNAHVWSLQVDRSTGLLVPGSLTDWTTTLNNSIAGSLSLIASFGEDSQGRLYIVGLGGTIYLLEGNDPPPPPINTEAVPLAPAAVLGLFGLIISACAVGRILKQRQGYID